MSEEFYGIDEALLLDQVNHEAVRNNMAPTTQITTALLYSDEHSPEFIEHVCQQLQSTLLHRGTLTTTASNTNNAATQTPSPRQSLVAPAISSRFPSSQSQVKQSTGTSTSNRRPRSPLQQQQQQRLKSYPQRHHNQTQYHQQPRQFDRPHDHSGQPKPPYKPSLSLSHESLIFQNSEMDQENDGVFHSAANASESQLISGAMLADSKSFPCTPLYMQQNTRSALAKVDSASSAAVFSDSGEPLRLEKWFKKRWTDIEDLLKVKALSQFP